MISCSYTDTNPLSPFPGFLLVTSFLSMWLSNTATAAMMAPLATAVIEHLTHKKEHDHEMTTTPQLPPDPLSGSSSGRSRGGNEVS